MTWRMSFLLQRKAECSRAFTTDMYESFMSVYFPTSTIETSSSTRSCLWVFCSRATYFGSEEAHEPFRKLLPALGNPFAPGDHSGGDIDGLQVQPFVEEPDQSLRP